MEITKPGAEVLQRVMFILCGNTEFTIAVPHRRHYFRKIFHPVQVVLLFMMRCLAYEMEKKKGNKSCGRNLYDSCAVGCYSIFGYEALKK